ncbi:DUF6531 domain-containing protein [Streptomyces celluloflavus]|uniref:DUF6531 domain-containing protein n=1 Tax=Streptomyces celluloflavus TaxID=58344 RepID=UPI0036DCCD75
MGVVLPGWADEVLDLIGVSWPNVDEDDYREMATAMREFADDIDDGAGQAHQAVQGLVSSAGGSLAVEALAAHWRKVNGTHLKNLAECGRMAATALDGVAVLIEGAKLGAVVQLGILAAEVIAAQAAAPFTLGLSEVGALGATQATRLIVKRLFKEVCQQVAEQVISLALTPVEEALGAMVGDLVVHLGANALGDSKGAAKPAGMQLLSAGGSGGGGGAGGGGGFSFDPDEHDRVVTGLQSAGGAFRNKAGGKIGKARSHHGRTRGKDAIADAANAMLDKVIDGIEDGVKKTAKHLDDSMTRGIRQMAKNHHENDRKLADHFTGLGKEGGKDPKSPSGGRGGAGTSTSRRSSASLRKGSQDTVATSKPMKGRCKDGDPIDMVSGEMLMEHTDLALPGLLSLTVQRTHISTYRWGRWFGPSWASTLDQRLELDDHGAVFAAEDGMLLSYPVPQREAPTLPVEGPRWPMEWDGQPGSAIRITDPDTGHTRHFAPCTPAGADGGRFVLRIVALSDRNGHRIEFDYAPDGAPTAVRHLGGYHIAIDTSDGRVMAARLLNAEEGTENTVLVRYGYTDGLLTQVTNSSGQSREFTYDTWSRIASWADRNGSRYAYTYDGRHRVIRGEGSDGFLNCTITYDRDERTTAYTNSLGHTTTHHYNELFQRTAVTDALGNVSRSEWDRHNRLLSQTDALGRTTRYTYDAAGNVTAATRPDGHASTAVYNDLGLPLQVTEPDGATWHHTYDDRGNRLSTTDPAGATTHYAHDGFGRPLKVTDALGHTRSVVTNPAGLPIQITDALGHTSVAERDAFGRVRTLTDPLGRTEHFTWSIEGKPVRREHPDGARESWNWDGEGNLTSHTDRLGNTSSYTFTHFHQVASRTTPDGHTHTFAYDTEVNLVGVRSPQGGTWQYEYDPVNRLISETDFNLRTLTYTHDPSGQLTARTDGQGATHTFVRDVLGRPVEQHAGGQTTTFRYDLAGSLLHAANADTTVTREYDVLGQTLAETVNGRTTSYTYDALGQRLTRRTPSGTVTHWTYDATGRPSTLSTADYQLSFSFDAAGREITRALGPGVTLFQEWDLAGRMASQTLGHGAGAAGSVLQHREYAYRADGHLGEIRELTTGIRRFDLDPGGRVTGVHAATWRETYAYDVVGNLTRAETGDPSTSSVLEFSGTRVRRAGRTVYEHDSQGRLVRTFKRLLNGQRRVQTYTWDAEGRLTGTVTPDGSRWRYQYDPAGRRTAKQRLDVDGSPAEETLFTWDGTRLAEQVTSTGHTTSWDYTPGTHRPLTQLDRTVSDAEVDARFHAIVTDLVGSPTELVSPDGVLAWHLRTTLWGIPVSRLGSGGADCPLRFAGQYADEETGWNYNYFRHYDPETARYVSPDPLGLAPDPNDYAYVSNPLTFCDPLGLARIRGAGGRWERDPNSPQISHNRDTEYPGSYRQSTHDQMAAQWTDEGLAQGGTPVYQSGSDAGMRIPRNELTWRNSDGDIVPSDELTYEHLNPVVQHWNSTGYDSDRTTRNDFYNDVDHMEPMSRSENSSGGARMGVNYRQDTGPNYSCS